MKIYTMKAYPPGAKKLYHSKPGDVVRRVFNDGSPEDLAYYLVAKAPHEKVTANEIRLVRLDDGVITTAHCSSRVITYPQATVCPDGLHYDDLGD
jgi:hypothetical protein